MCNQCLSPLKSCEDEVESHSWRGIFDTTCHYVCQWLAVCRWFSLHITVSTTNKTDHHDITEILLKKSGVKHHNLTLIPSRIVSLSRIWIFWLCSLVFLIAKSSNYLATQCLDFHRTQFWQKRVVCTELDLYIIFIVKQVGYHCLFFSKQYRISVFFSSCI